MQEDSLGEIVVALDGSPTAHVAAQIAIQIAQNQGLAIRGLNVVDEILVMAPYLTFQAELGTDEPPRSQSELIDWFKAQGTLELGWLETLCLTSKVPYQSTLVFGGVPDTILNEAERATLLALGRRGRSHLEAVERLGQNFKQIAQRTSLPILVGGDDQRYIQHILFGYDGSQHADHALEWVVRLQADLSARLSIIAVDEIRDSSHYWLTQIQKRLEKKVKSDFQFISRMGDPQTNMLAVAEESQADLIVIGEYRHAAFLEWLVGSKADYLLRNTRLPLVIA